MTTYAIYFPLNAYFKKINPLHLNNQYAVYTFATIPPSLISMTLCNPMWTIKAKQIGGGEVGMHTAIRQIYEMSGYRGFYKGLMFGYVNSLNGIMSFTLYDILKDVMRGDAVSNNTMDYVICSLASKTIATICCFPIFVLRIRQQIDQTSFSQTLRKMLTQRSIYSGIMFTLAQQLPKNTILLFTYECLLTIFNKINN